MPVSSISGIFSTSVYFVSMLLLLVVLLNPIVNVYRSASLQAATHLADGVSAEVAGLAPGMNSTLEFDSYPGTQLSVRLAGTQVTATVNGQTATARARLAGCDATLNPGSTYEMFLSDGVVEIA